MRDGSRAAHPVPGAPRGGHALGRGSRVPGHPSAPTPGHGRTEAPTKKQSKTSPFAPKGESQTPPVPAGAQLVPGCQLAWGWMHPKIWASPGAAWPGGGRQHAGKHPLTCSHPPPLPPSSTGTPISVGRMGVCWRGWSHMPSLGKPPGDPNSPPPPSTPPKPASLPSWLSHPGWG